MPPTRGAATYRCNEIECAQETKIIDGNQLFTYKTIRRDEYKLIVVDEFFYM
jgi:hypothetical protein